ncbi:MAG: hypothetical protein WDO56_09700 [Gammaproteobacteria bacterium]
MTLDVIHSDPSARAWRNNITGECRLEQPKIGELDWIEDRGSDLCTL